MSAEPLIFDRIAGWREVLEWFGDEPGFGNVPEFGDSEILSLHLNRSGISELRIHWYRRSGRVAANGEEIYRHAIVTLRLEGIVDLVLDGFSHQNVVGGLQLMPALDRGRSGIIGPRPPNEDIDLVLEPCFGLDGWIRCKKVSIALESGVIPPDSPHSFAPD